ncbi:MAG: 16S rRNA (uracil(1498)-N(3))-methyltransferase [Bacteroidetes bacterium MedPE-SWsnd-G1]|nr:MAG: 16S rRNA (uracil(1498)-N(3))-methyltransferase [Bacteroidetes bacterium MedPE-SWsnd-G1]
MQLFYSEHISNNSAQFTFDKIESRHIVKVLRKNTGDQLNITNGKGDLFTVEIVLPNEKKCLVDIVNSEKREKPWNYYLHIAIAPTKNNDRYEWFLEKATEIGIDEITPIICKHSERKVIKKERFDKVIISAMKQSLKFQLPKLNDVVSFSEFVSKEIEGEKLIAHCVETDKKTLKQVIQGSNKITILIGPEGDFSFDEIEKALGKNFEHVTFGASRLRTETAGIVAAHSVSILNEN